MPHYGLALVLWMGLACVIDFALMGADKRRAKAGVWRISEATLWLFAFLGGASGGCLGMLFFHHKTRHLPFRLGLPALTFLQLLLLLVVLRP